jgi:hypothetical protein
MDKLLLGIICLLALSGCGAEDESNDISQDGKDTAEIELTNNNWDKGNWNEIDWQ